MNDKGMSKTIEEIANGLRKLAVKVERLEVKRFLTSGSVPPGGDTVSEGPGIDIVAGVTKQIGLGGDTILIYDFSGAPVAEFPFTEVGIKAALASVTADDVIELPQGYLGMTNPTFTPNPSFPATDQYLFNIGTGVKIRGKGRQQTVVRVITNIAPAKVTTTIFEFASDCVIEDLTLSVSSSNCTALDTLYLARQGSFAGSNEWEFNRVSLEAYVDTGLALIPFFAYCNNDTYKREHLYMSDVLISSKVTNTASACKNYAQLSEPPAYSHIGRSVIRDVYCVFEYGQVLGLILDVSGSAPVGSYSAHNISSYGYSILASTSHQAGNFHGWNIYEAVGIMQHVSAASTFPAVGLDISADFSSGRNEFFNVYGKAIATSNAVATPPIGIKARGQSAAFPLTGDGFFGECIQSGTGNSIGIWGENYARITGGVAKASGGIAQDVVLDATSEIANMQYSTFSLSNILAPLKSDRLPDHLWIHLYRNGVLTQGYAFTSAGFIAALAASTVGDVIELPTGTITITNPTLVPDPLYPASYQYFFSIPAGVTVRGQGKNRTKIVVTSNANLSLATHVFRIRHGNVIEDLEIDVTLSGTISTNFVAIIKQWDYTEPITFELNRLSIKATQTTVWTGFLNNFFCFEGGFVVSIYNTAEIMTDVEFYINMNLSSTANANPCYLISHSAHRGHAIVRGMYAYTNGGRGEGIYLDSNGYGQRSAFNITSYVYTTYSASFCTSGWLLGWTLYGVKAHLTQLSAGVSGDAEGLLIGTCTAYDVFSYTDATNNGLLSSYKGAGALYVESARVFGFFAYAINHGASGDAFALEDSRTYGIHGGVAKAEVDGSGRAIDILCGLGNLSDVTHMSIDEPVNLNEAWNTNLRFRSHSRGFMLMGG